MQEKRLLLQFTDVFRYYIPKLASVSSEGCLRFIEIRKVFFPQIASHKRQPAQLGVKLIGYQLEICYKLEKANKVHDLEFSYQFVNDKFLACHHELLFVILIFTNPHSRFTPPHQTQSSFSLKSVNFGLGMQGEAAKGLQRAHGISSESETTYNPSQFHSITISNTKLIIFFCFVEKS